MRLTMIVFALAGLFAAGLVWIAPNSPAARIPLEELALEQPYAVEVSLDRSRLDLDLGEQDRYLLIVGSLADDHRPHNVTLSGEPIEAVAALPARRLEPLGRSIRGQRSDVRGQRPENRPRPMVALVSHPPSSILYPLSATAGASPSREGSPSQGAAAATRDFFLHVTDGPLDHPRHYARVTGRLAGEGGEVRVYLDAQQQTRELAPGLVDEIVRLLDDELFPAIRQQVGACRDIDGNGKFTVLLSPWLGKLQGGKTSLGGFVRESDFRGDVAAPFGNRCDMMYLNSGLTAGPHLRTLLAHELMHAVCFSARLPSAERPNGLPDEEDWLNEAIAHLAENLYGDGWSNLDYRISRYLSEPQSYPLVVDDYYHSGLWRNHGCRGATYLFLRWCVDEFGVEIVERLIRAPGRGRANVRHATGIEFAELFRRWTVALCLSNRRRLPEEAPASAAVGAAGYRSLNLRGRIADWGLAGPRTVDWDVDEGPCTLQVGGTSAAFVAIGARRSAGKRRIEIAGEPGTKLQVTLIKLPADWPALDVQPRWSKPESEAGAQAALTLEIEDRRGTGLKIEQISFERNQAGAKESVCYTGASLAGRRVSSDSESTQSFLFDLPASARQGGWLAKIVAYDERGRCAARFIDVPAAAAPGDPLRLARVPAAIAR